MSIYMYVLAISKDKVLLLMIILIMPGIVLCVGLLVVLPSPAEARATGGWLRFLKMLEEMKEDYPFPAEVEEKEQEEESESSELTPHSNNLGSRCKSEHLFGTFFSHFTSKVKDTTNTITK